MIFPATHDDFDQATPAAEAIATFQYRRVVRFVDTDGWGFAHFSSYVRMMEETEYAFLRSRGLNVKLTDERGTMGFPRLHASLQVHQPLVFDESVTVHLHLDQLDGKAIQYSFDLVDERNTVRITGKFQVALCRFPDNKPPYAILTPDYVIEALTATTI